MRDRLAQATTVLLLALPASAQFINRATWLGGDEEGLRRNFPQSTEYFLDRFGYVATPPWWDPELRRFHDQATWRAGSTSGTQFTVEGQLDHRIELGDGFSFRYHVLQSEHRDARFLRNEMALEHDLGDQTAVFAQASLFADKSLIDVSLGAWLWRRRDEGLRVMLTAVDWTNEKSRLVEYESDPYAAMVAGAFGAGTGHRIVFELASQLPFTQRTLATADRFELERHLGSMQSYLRLAERLTLVSSVEAERTTKQQGPSRPGPVTEDFDRTFWQARVECWRDGDIPWSIGLLHTWNDEDGRRPDDPANDLRARRREWFGLLRAQFRVGAKLSFEPHLFAGTVRDSFRDGIDERDEDRFEGKINWNARWQFSPDVSLALIVGTQLDELAFGGGGAQFVARF